MSAAAHRGCAKARILLLGLQKEEMVEQRVCSAGFLNGARLASESGPSFLRSVWDVAQFWEVGREHWRGPLVTHSPMGPEWLREPQRLFATESGEYSIFGRAFGRMPVP